MSKVKKIAGKTNNDLAESLKRIGKEPALRENFVSFCKEVEEVIILPDRSTRNEITGPLIDALYADVDVVSKKLKQELVFKMKYRSIIARDFVMSDEKEPDHVWEPQTTKLLLNLCENAKQVLIGGAYCGDHAVLVANQIINSEGICHAFEPNSDQFEMLIENMKANGLDNIVLNCIGLWEDNDITLQLCGYDSHAYAQVAGDEALNNVFSAVSIDTYGQNHGIKKLDMIMLDLEGGELPALKGARQYLSQPIGQAPNIIFEIHRNYADWSNGLQNTELLKLLNKFGYHIFSIRDYHSNVATSEMPVELIPPETTCLEGPPHGFNMLAIKNLDLIDSPFFHLCNNVSPKLLKHKTSSMHHPMKS
ncbi:FkbM family methyltransferase [Thermodesulfobacteriota bacterium]